MLNYDFKMLSDYEFELLSMDLLMKELKCCPHIRKVWMGITAHLKH